MIPKKQNLQRHVSHSIRSRSIVDFKSKSLYDYTISRHSPILSIQQSFSRQSSSTRLMKRPPRSKQEVAPVSDSDEKIPANLKRKLTVKRPFLGHVVPKGMKGSQTKGGTSDPKLRAQGKARGDSINNPSNLKILGGTARGRKLDSPDVYLRPMMGKVREAVYSTFTSFGLYEIANTAGDEDGGYGSVTAPTRHLDIFAGSGSVGLESLSRGASHCTFVDLARDCCDTVERNLKICDFEGRGEVKCCDVYQALLQPRELGIDGTFDIVTLCPPYEEIIYADLLSAVANSPLVRDDTVVMVEYPVELGSLPHVLDRDVEGDEGKLIGVRNRKYGRTVIAMYVVNPTGNMEVAQSRPEEFITF